MTRNKFLLATLGALLFLSSLLVSCKTKGTFDPRAEGTEVEEHEFLNVDMGSISKADLRPRAEPYRIGSGDLLEIDLVEEQGMAAETLVMPDGMIYYDLARGVRAAGLTPEELETKLTEKLEAHYPAPFVSARILKYGSQTYTMLGQFENPGSYALGQPTTLLQAISLAGGLSGFTQEVVDLDRSLVLRGTEVVPVDFDALIRKGDMNYNIYLQPGDFVFLAEASGAVVHVLGDVVRAAVVPHTSRTTFITAMAQAGGPNRSAHMSQIALIRGTLKEPKITAVNFNDIVKGKQQDFKLEPGDIIWVPTAPWELLESYAKNFVRSAATAIVIRYADRDRGQRSSPVVVEP